MTIKERLEALRAKLAERQADAEQDAKWARAPDEHLIHQTRADELAWCYKEITTILGDEH